MQPSSTSNSSRSCIARLLGVGAAFLVVFGASPADAAERRSATLAKPVTISVRTVHDVALRHECFRLDKTTGEKIPCASSGRTGGSSRGGSTSPPASDDDDVSPAFDDFGADYSEADYLDDPESVIPNAYLLAHLSAISYRNPGHGSDDQGEQAYALAEAAGLEHEPVIRREYTPLVDPFAPEGESLAYVFHNDDALFVVFQGSKGATDWTESNLDFAPWPKPSWGSVPITRCVFAFGCYTLHTQVVKLHDGFYEAMDIIYDDVLDAIEPLLAGRKLWITGHSLGGAIAQLTAFRLEHEDDIDVQGLHVFGAPAVGEGYWADAFEDTVSNAHRWNIQGDPAPVATQWPMFHHVGFVNNIYDGGALVLDDAQMFGLWSECGPVHGIVHTHMAYWPVMHDVLDDFYPELVEAYPQPLPGGDVDC